MFQILGFTSFVEENGVKNVSSSRQYVSTFVLPVVYLFWVNRVCKVKSQESPTSFRQSWRPRILRVWLTVEILLKSKPLLWIIEWIFDRSFESFVHKRITISPIFAYILSFSLSSAAQSNVTVSRFNEP